MDMACRNVRIPVFGVFFLFLVTAGTGRSLLPLQYEGEMCKVKAATYPSRMVVKYFKPVDKGFSVEIGEPTASVYEIEYDERHNAHRFKEFDLEGNLKEQYDRSFTEQGLLKSEQKRGANRLVQLSSDYAYGNPDRSNTLLSQKIYDSDKKLLYVESYQRDKQGNVTSMQRTNVRGEVLYSYEYHYDEDGNLEREIRLNASGEKVSEDEYVYDGDGVKMADIHYDSKGKMVSHTDYRYDGNGLMEEVTLTVPGGPMQRYRMQYEFDDRGNWIRQVISKGGDVPVSVIVRKIEYF